MYVFNPIKHRIHWLIQDMWVSGGWCTACLCTDRQICNNKNTSWTEKWWCLYDKDIISSTLTRYKTENFFDEGSNRIKTPFLYLPTWQCCLIEPTVKCTEKRWIDVFQSHFWLVQILKIFNPIPYGISIPAMKFTPPAKNTIRGDIFQFCYTNI